jgi:hypothetical protein
MSDRRRSEGLLWLARANCGGGQYPMGPSRAGHHLPQDGPEGGKMGLHPFWASGTPRRAHTASMLHLV